MFCKVQQKCWHFPNFVRVWRRFDVVDQGLLLWQLKWLAVAFKDWPDTLAKCDEKRFLNLFVLLKIACTFPIASAECKHSFSAICRLRTFLTARIKMKRLDAVSIMNIYWQEEVDYKHVSELFFNSIQEKFT